MEILKRYLVIILVPVLLVLFQMNFDVEILNNSIAWYSEYQWFIRGGLIVFLIIFWMIKKNPKA